MIQVVKLENVQNQLTLIVVINVIHQVVFIYLNKQDNLMEHAIIYHSVKLWVHVNLINFFKKKKKTSFN